MRTEAKGKKFGVEKGEDKVMAGDSSKLRNEYEDISQDRIENDGNSGGDFEDGVEDLDPDNISSNDGEASGEGEPSETDHGGIDMV